MAQLTIEQLADRAGLTTQSVRRYLATERAIEVDIMYAIAQALEMSGAEVMTRAQERLEADRATGAGVYDAVTAEEAEEARREIRAALPPAKKSAETPRTRRRRTG